MRKPRDCAMEMMCSITCEVAASVPIGAAMPCRSSASPAATASGRPGWSSRCQSRQWQPAGPGGAVPAAARARRSIQRTRSLPHPHQLVRRHAVRTQLLLQVGHKRSVAHILGTEVHRDMPVRMRHQQHPRIAQHLPHHPARERSNEATALGRMNTSGATRCHQGRRQRTSASSPTQRPVANSTTGW